MDLNLGLEFLGEVGQHGCGAGMQAGGIGDENGFRRDDFGRLDRSLRFSARQRQFQHHILAGSHPAGRGFKLRDPFAIGDDNLREQAFGVGGDVVGVELDQRIAHLHRITGLNVGRKPDALEIDGIQANMHQDFNAFRGGHGHGMSGWMQLDDPTGTGRTQALIEWVDGNPVTNHFLGEDRIRNSFQGDQRAGERCDQGNPDCGRISKGRDIH